jgi:hypothetical protein
MSKVIDKKQAIAGIVIAILPWILRLFGIDMPASSGLEDLIFGGITATGATIAARAKAL